MLANHDFVHLEYYTTNPSKLKSMNKFVSNMQFNKNGGSKKNLIVKVFVQWGLHSTPSCCFRNATGLKSGKVDHIQSFCRNNSTNYPNSTDNNSSSHYLSLCVNSPAQNRIWISFLVDSNVRH